MEEYYDYIFPDEAAAAPNLKILEAAYRWKRQRLEAEEQEGAPAGGDQATAAAAAGGEQQAAAAAAGEEG